MRLQAGYDPAAQTISVCISDHGSWHRRSWRQPHDPRASRGITCAWITPQPRSPEVGRFKDVGFQQLYSLYTTVAASILTTEAATRACARIRSPGGAALQAAAQADHREAGPQPAHLAPGDRPVHPARAAAVQADQGPVAAGRDPLRPPRHRRPSRRSREHPPTATQRLTSLFSSLDPFLISVCRFISAFRAPCGGGRAGGADGQDGRRAHAVNAPGRLPGAAAHREQVGGHPATVQGPRLREVVAEAAPAAAGRPVWASGAALPSRRPGRPTLGAGAWEHRTRPARSRTVVVPAWRTAPATTGPPRRSVGTVLSVARRK